MVKIRKNLIAVICDYCGSDNVTASANVYWDFKKQRWEIGDSGYDSYCNDCEGDSSLSDIDLKEYPERKGTKRAVLVDSVSGGYGDSMILYSNEVPYFIDLPAKYEDDHLTALEDSLVILKKRSSYRWEIAENDNFPSPDNA